MQGPRATIVESWCKASYEIRLITKLMSKKKKSLN